MKGKGPSKKDQYFVAVKVFLCDARGRLFIFKDRFGDWDLPGGRLLPSEFNTPFDKIVARKLKEELGGAMRYKLGRPLVLMRHQRKEVLANRKRETRRIFAVGFEAKYRGGRLRLSPQHIAAQWVALKNFKPEKYFTGGWLKGVREYLEQYENNRRAKS